MRTLSKAALAAAAAAMLVVPPAALARGGGLHGGFRAGPVFGFPRPMVHHGFGHGFARRWPARFAWRWQRWSFHRGNTWGTGYALGGDATGYAAPYYPGDVTGTIPGPGATGFAPPAPPASEHAGCQSRAYDVPAESGGVVKVSVTRC